MENLYSCLLSPMWGLSKKWMEILNILFAKLDQECVAELFLNSIKSKGSLKIMRLHMISWYHTWMLWLKIAKISQKFTHTFLQNEESLKKIHRVEKDSLRSQRIKLGFDFKTFCVGNRHHRLFHVKFWLFLGPFDNFNFSTIVKLTLIYIESELINHRIMDFLRWSIKKERLSEFWKVFSNYVRANWVTLVMEENELKEFEFVLELHEIMVFF